METANYVSPRPLRATKLAISTFAEQVASHVGYTAGSSMHALVTRLNGRISYSDDPMASKNLQEAIVVRPDGTFHVFLPSVTSPERDRFTIAHELGHYFLHYPAITSADPQATMMATRWVDESSETQKRAEWEANWFAASFLMPSDEFRRWRQKGLAAAASHFGVSQKAAEVRAQSLGL